MTMLDNVGIIGRTQTLRQAPYDDPTWEFWGHSGWQPGVRRYDRWMELHDVEDPEVPFLPGHLDWLARQTIPIDMFTLSDKVPFGARYPKELIEAVYGTHFLTSTVAWGMARAHYQGARRVGLWGVCMGTDTEYKEQRDGVLHFKLLLESHGVEVIIPPESSLVGMAPPYPENSDIAQVA